ncbi:MAG TPA: serine/threonine-protein kinase PknK, partial [Leptospiraceae bacterium]|nr:serine/threonine-protein kinase PknK [Leptospiraceae bacterium]
MDQIEFAFENKEILHKNASIEVSRVKIRGQENSVIVKRIISPSPEAYEYYRLKNEFKILSKFPLSKSVKVIRLVNERTLVLEDTGGISLKTYLVNTNLTIVEFLDLAIRMADALDEVHKKNIIHKDIKPSNIIIHPITKEIRFTDFGIATLFAKEYIPSLGKLEGSIEYVSPEQTGRTGTALDYRTDLYSLGITFYEILTGELPFKNKDQNQILHSHIAQQPKPLSEIYPSIPNSISDIVSKLISKSPEARYQSAEGLKLDLLELASAIGEGRIPSGVEGSGIEGKFFAGKNDFSEKFSIPQKLYGRDREIQSLKNSFLNLFSKEHRTATLQLINGYSGIGKTSLVQELNQPVVEKNGIFISGKFEQYQKNVPFFAVVQAFRELTRQLLAKDKTELLNWKNELKEALGNIGQVILDVVPEVELFLGKQPPIPDVPPDQAFNRFKYAFSQFVRVFAKEKHPLVLFLDDLQWADMASLSLLKNLLTDTDIIYFFVVGAYRDNEVDSSHSLTFFLHDLEKNGLKIENLQLGNLDKDSVLSLVSDSLLSKKEDSLELTELLLEKTDGNPFFVRQFLQSLYEENLINISERKWKWNISEIRNKSVSDNVLDLMLQKIEKLTEPSQLLLGYASCIGNQFDLKVLSFLLQKTTPDVISILEECIKAGLIIPLSDSYKWIESDSSDNCSFRFLHDRVQQASYRLVKEEEKAKIHFIIGKILLEHTAKEELQEKLFDIVDQLNYGLDLIQTEEEKIQIVELNIQAGKQAKASVAYNGALGYFKNAEKLFSKDAWDTNYSLIYQCVTELGETEFLCGNFEEADITFEIGLANAKSRLDKAGIYNLKVVLYTGQGKYNQAIETGLLGLELYEFKTPENFGVTNVFKEIKAVKALIGDNPVNRIKTLPELVDKDKLMHLHLLINLVDSTYFTDKILNGYIVLQSIQFSLINGVSLAGYISFVSFGNLLCANSDYQFGFEIGKYINEITSSNNLTLIKSKSDNIFCAHINHWKRHIKTGFEFQLEGFKAGIETGDLSYAGYNVAWYLWYRFFHGANLEGIQKENLKFLEFALKVKNKNLELLIRIIVQTIQILREEDIKEKDSNLFEECRKSEMKIPLFGYLLLDLELNYHLERFETSPSIIKQSFEHQDSVFGLMFYLEFHFYYALTLIAMHLEAGTEQAQNEKAILQEIKLWKRWAEACPENYLHKSLLIQAEWARVKGEVVSAMDLYEEAIESAKKNDYILNHALASKLAGKFYLSLNKPKFAYLFFMDAFFAYKNQGADLYARDLEEKYLKKHFQYMGKERRQQKVSDSTSTTLASIDLNSLLKASRVISSEVKLELLLKNLLYIIIENAGAERGVLLLEEKGDYLIFAESKANSETNLEKRQQDNSHLPLSLIQLVLHTKEYVILHQAKEDK